MINKGKFNKISIDVTGLNDTKRTGVQNVLWSIVDAVEEYPNEFIQYEIIFYDNSAQKNIELENYKNIKYVSFADQLPQFLNNKIKRLFIKFGLIDTKILDNSVNLIWNYDLQTSNKTKHSIYIHDLLPLEYPKWFAKSFYDSTKKSLDFAASKDNSLVICNSHYTASAYRQAYPNSHSKTKVIYPAIRASFFEDYDKSKVSLLLDKYDLEYKKYIVSYGFIDPRKNIINQVTAFQELIKSKRFCDVKYVLIGPKNPKTDKIKENIEQNKLSKNICILDYIKQDELEIIIKNSLGVSYCSLAEGFGLPIVEAMASEVPVITSNTTSMIEVANKRAILVDPTDVQMIARGMKTLISEQPSQSEIANNKNYARFFNNLRFAKELMEALAHG